MNKKAIIITLIVFVITFITLLVAFNVNTYLNIDFSHFNKELWNKYPDKRHEMIADFEKNFPIEELNKENTIDLLGESDMTKADNVYTYIIGGDNLINTNYYALTFDQQGQCINRQIYID